MGSCAEPSKEVREAKDRSVRAPSFIDWIPGVYSPEPAELERKGRAESAPAVGPEGPGIRSARSPAGARPYNPECSAAVSPTPGAIAPTGQHKLFLMPPEFPASRVGAVRLPGVGETS